MVKQFYLIVGTQTGTTALSQSGPESKGNEGVLHIPPKLQDWSLTIR